MDKLTPKQKAFADKPLIGLNRCENLERKK